jgi:ribosomal protein L33
VLGGVRVAGSGRAGERESGRERERTARLISHTRTNARSLTRPRTRHTRHTRQYTTQKSKKNTPERIEMKKYNKYLRRHTLHREIK